METVETGESIAVASDFDVDGIMSGFILHKGFAESADGRKIYTPDRVAEGYGLNMRIVDEALDDGCGVIVTCDNGIAAFEAVEYARAKGLKVIVTDHHDIPFEEDENGRHPQCTYRRMLLSILSRQTVPILLKNCAVPVWPLNFYVCFMMLMIYRKIKNRD